MSKSVMEQLADLRKKETALLAQVASGLEKKKNELAELEADFNAILSGRIPTGTATSQTLGRTNRLPQKPKKPTVKVKFRQGRPPTPIAGVNFRSLFVEHEHRFYRTRNGSPSLTHELAVALANGDLRLTNRGNGYLITVDCVLEHFGMHRAYYQRAYKALYTVTQVYGLSWRSRHIGDKCYSGIFVKD